ncbi:hypothetical protein NDN08_005759 [Rhodosorus marinus]|uniref:Aminotransferase class V domain-containing protein n=1 Tax=Rhodosorus marinus TaxID=101924 RepID=A0AAV8V4M6_9RHOD|nr:hypothetical protein NDN08_005759 [Rhodosorus marinus]
METWMRSLPGVWWESNDEKALRGLVENRVKVDDTRANPAEDENCRCFKRAQTDNVSSPEQLRQHASGKLGMKPQVWTAKKVDSLGYQNAHSKFLTDFSEFAETEQRFQAIRDKDFSCLEEQELTYLDYTGSMLTPLSLIDSHTEFLRKTIIANPHSNSLPSEMASGVDERARLAVLNMFHADPSEYTIIWTQNATGALKLVGESYPFGEDGVYMYSPDSHNSVLGVARYAKHYRMFPFVKGSWMWDAPAAYKLMTSISEVSKRANKLVAISGQSNVSGIKHPLGEMVRTAHENGWDVMLDSAAMAPTSLLNLSEIGVEYACVSFYKMFGYPTGIGALVAKKSALQKLNRPWFSGGTVRMVRSDAEKGLYVIMHKKDNAEYFEDGTPNFQMSAAVEQGVRYVQSIGIDRIRVHTSCLIRWIGGELRELYWDEDRHGRTKPLLKFPELKSDTGCIQGSSLAFAMYTKENKLIPHQLIGNLARERGIAIRTGCFCNPGTGLEFFQSSMHNLSSGKFFEFADGNCAEDILDEFRGIGFIRVSVGFPTTFMDAFKFVTFLKEDILRRPKVISALADEWLKKMEPPASLC